MKKRYKRASDLFFCTAFLICLTASAFGQNMFRKVNDFDGDGKADFAVTRDIGGNKYWYIWQSRDGFRVNQFGLASDQNDAGDYDGDGKYDPAIFRKTPVAPNSVHCYPSFWVQGSQNGVFAFTRSTVFCNSYAVSQDYNGDGKTDFAAIYTPNSNGMLIYFYAQSQSDGVFLSSELYSLKKMGDMSGDGKADIFAYDPYNFVALTKNYSYQQQGTERTVQFGMADDQLVAGDFDGDGKGDLTIFRQTDGTWWCLRSSDNALTAAQFGQNGDVPVPADYDGDGKTDLAIWRAGRYSGVYWVYGSLGSIWAMEFGLPTDIVVRY